LSLKARINLQHNHVVPKTQQTSPVVSLNTSEELCVNYRTIPEKTDADKPRGNRLCCMMSSFDKE